MSECIYKEGYLLMYGSDSDEIHLNLISETHYDKIVAALDDPDKSMRMAFETDPLYSWFSQTQCNEPYPYNNVKILGTVHVWCY